MEATAAHAATAADTSAPTSGIGVFAAASAFPVAATAAVSTHTASRTPSINIS